MVKKGVKKTANKKGNSKKLISKKRVKRKISSKKEEKRIESKKNLALKKLGLFIALFVITFGLFGVSQNSLYVSIFKLFSIIFGFLIIAMLVSYLALIILKNIRK